MHKLLITIISKRVWYFCGILITSLHVSLTGQELPTIELPEQSPPPPVDPDVVVPIAADIGSNTNLLAVLKNTATDNRWELRGCSEHCNKCIVKPEYKSRQ